MKFTGERMVPEENRGDVIWAEHYIRYIFVSQFVHNKTVLDIACGSGFGTLYLSLKEAKKVIGIDVSTEAINYAKKNFSTKNTQYLQGACENIPLKNNSVDTVVSFETIEHIAEHEKFLKEIKRVSKQDSLLVVSTPNSSIHPKGNPFHIKEFNYSQLNKALSKYYKNVKFLYQHNWFSSAVLDKKTIEKESLFESLKNINLFKLISDNSSKSLYYIVLASDKKIPDVISSPLGIFSPFIDFNENLVSLTQQNEILGNQNRKKDNELNNIYDSRSWKLMKKLKKLKNALPIIAKL